MHAPGTKLMYQGKSCVVQKSVGGGDYLCTDKDGRFVANIKDLEKIESVEASAPVEGAETKGEEGAESETPPSAQ